METLPSDTAAPPPDGFHLALLIAAGLVAGAAIAVATLLRGRDRSASGTAA